MDPIKVDFGGNNSKTPKAIVIPPEKAALKIIISVLLTGVFAAVLYYFMLPPLNFKAYEFYGYVGLVIASFVVFLFIISRALSKPEYVPYVKKSAIVPICLILVLAIIAGIGYVVGCVFFRSKDYSQLIAGEVTLAGEDELGNQLSDGSSLSKVSKLDIAAASVIADKKLTDLKDLGKVSQYDVSDITSQINLNIEKLADPKIKGEEKPVRVFSLRYQNIIKWLYNKNDGLPGYVVVDTSNSKSYFYSVEGGIQYSLTDYFSSYITRHIRFAYPTYIFDTPAFEVDEDGTPWWVCTIIDKEIGLFGGRDVIGLVLVNAQTGDCYEYTLDEIEAGKAADDGTGRPTEIVWIDHVYSDAILLEQIDYYGRYQQGFWNSVLNQDGCVTATDGHNYIAYDGDMWLYTGISSLSLKDNSIVNFVIINQRTKETMWYSASGGTESAAQSSAEGLVTNYTYRASFPMLVNINGVPTYFMSLKDSATNYIKGFAMVSVEDFNDITAYALTNESSFTGAYEECKKNYVTVLDSSGKATTVDEDDPGTDPNNTSKPDDDAAGAKKVSGTVSAIKSAVVDGNTTYYIKLSSSAAYYSISADECEEAIILEVGDAVTLTYSGIEGGIISLDTLTLGAAQPEQTTAAGATTTAASVQ